MSISSISRVAHRTIHQAIAHAHEAIIALAVDKAHEASILVMLALAAALVAAFALQSALQVASAE